MTEDASRSNFLKRLGFGGLALGGISVAGLKDPVTHDANRIAALEKRVVFLESRDHVHTASPTPTATPTVAPTPTATPTPVPTTFSWGMFDPPYPVDYSGQAALATSLGRSPAVLHWFNAWTPWGSFAGWPNRDGIVDAHSRGKIPLITWEAWSGSGGRDGGNPFPLWQIAQGTFDAYIDSWANGIKALNSPIPVYLRPLHEMNISYEPGGYPWSVYKDGNPFGNTPAQYVAAWRHIVSRFRLVNANVKWVFNPTGDLTWNPVIPGVYPGDAYVDFVGFDAYEGPAAGSVAIDVGIVEAMSARPLILSEVGGRANWITNELGPALRRPRTAGAVWFNESVGVGVSLTDPTNVTALKTLLASL